MSQVVQTAEGTITVAGNPATGRVQLVVADGVNTATVNVAINDVTESNPNGLIRVLSGQASGVTA